MASQAVEQRGSHLGIAEHTWPFTEGKIGGDDDGRALVEPADEVEQELAAGLSERKVAKFVEDDEVHPGQMLGDTTVPSIAGLDLQAIDEVDHVVKAAAGTGSYAASGDGYGHMCFAGAGTPDQDGVTLLGDEAAAGSAFKICSPLRSPAHSASSKNTAHVSAPGQVLALSNVPEMLSISDR